jgi:MATE family multidrug resistance protein
VLAIPALGVVGSGISTSLARTYQAVFLIGSILYVNRKQGYGLLETSLWPDWPSIKRLLALGLPSGATILVEIAIFAIVTNIIATLGAVPLAGHEIALNCISFTFMAPLGISAAASIRVGQAIGRGSIAQAGAAGWTAIGMSAIVMLTASLVFWTMPRLLAAAFTPNPAVIAAAVPLLLIAAIFQFFDGMQITAIGALRGAGNTHSGLITHLCSYWLFGLPLGLYLCFGRHLGARGLWLGLCAALVVAGMVLIQMWRRQLRLTSIKQGVGSRE